MLTIFKKLAKYRKSTEDAIEDGVYYKEKLQSRLERSKSNADKLNSKKTDLEEQLQVAGTKMDVLLSDRKKKLRFEISK